MRTRARDVVRAVAPYASLALVFLVATAKRWA